MQEPPLHEIHKVPLQEQGLNEGDNKYNDGRPEELTYRQNWANQVRDLQQDSLCFWYL